MNDSKDARPVGERKRALRLKLFAVWKNLEEGCTEERLRGADRAWRSYQIVVANDATMPGEARKHLEEVRQSDEYVRYSTMRREHLRASAQKRAREYRKRHREQINARRRTQRRKAVSKRLVSRADEKADFCSETDAVTPLYITDSGSQIPDPDPDKSIPA